MIADAGELNIIISTIPEGISMIGYASKSNHKTETAMKQIDENQKINVEALMSQLLKRKTMTERFKLPYTFEQTKDMLTACVMAEVAFRHQEYKKNQDMESYIDRTARWLNDGGTFGLLLCGVPGNGKTTLMRAIQTLVNMIDIKNIYDQPVAMITVDAREITRLNRDSYDQFKAI